ncbi:uncharacterized protein FA14DRAFT_154481 [Meira miltonrushii]|uniref:Uncharacterized protein n=1 Tax=Meira miltonrushii TaxID=1280837 RepID=A0A316VGC4_9BASI|nr:uncharacterized protein FA14DRAFT_154481 [Meira miltonrushii]PWN35051.1 hypothetical protein FA14DRAFT_154481 [Meira miltonrushii]
MHSSSIGLRTYFELIELGLGNEFPNLMRGIDFNPIKGSNGLSTGSVILMTYYTIFTAIRQYTLKGKIEKAKLKHRAKFEPPVNAQPHSQNCFCSKACIHRYDKIISSLQRKLYTSGSIIRQLKTDLAEANQREAPNNDSGPSSLGSSSASID